MLRRILLAAACLFAFLSIDLWLRKSGSLADEAFRPAKPKHEPVLDAATEPPKEESHEKEAGLAPGSNGAVTAPVLSAQSAVFGASGPVLIADVPAGRFRNELMALAPDARARALKKLGDLRVPLHDIASLQVDAGGHLYYECASLGTRLAGELSKLAALSAPASVPAPITGEASVPIASPPVRHSKSGASKVIYLDFNGHTITGTSWNNAKGTLGDWNYRPAVESYVAKPFSTDGDGTTFSDSEQARIVRIWQRVAEDFKPFDVDVTTEEPASFTATTGRVLITPSVDATGINLPSSTAAGVAYIGVFGDADYVSAHSPAFVYSDVNYNQEHYIAETASHEIGHNLSLSHDGTAGEEYYSGHGYGETSWNSIMGGAFTEYVTQWSKGEYPGANNTQDDLAIIAGGCRPDC